MRTCGKVLYRLRGVKVTAKIGVLGKLEYVGAQKRQDFWD